MNKSTCSKCGLPIRAVNIEGKKEDFCWLHEDYREAWQVDAAGIARALHFASPVLSEKENENTDKG